MTRERAASLEEVARFLLDRFAPAEDDVPVIWRASNRPVCCLALALDPPSILDPAVDVLFLHRPYRLPAEAFPEVAVLSAHRAFDDHLTTGFNPPLASALGLCRPEPLDPERPLLGMRGAFDSSLPGETFMNRVKREFGGWEERLGTVPEQVERVAIANAMTPATLALVADGGAQVYLTGQLRDPGIAEAQRLGIAVLALGHHRVERWGLAQLARELEAAFPGLETRLLDP